MELPEKQGLKPLAEPAIPLLWKPVAVELPEKQGLKPFLVHIVIDF